MAHNWGIIGAGGIARTLAAALKEASGAELLAVGSRSLDKAKAFAADHGAARAYGSYEELLADGDVEFVYNALPNALHAEWTIKATQAGKHVLCEKPISVTPDEAEAMFDSIAESLRFGI